MRTAAARQRDGVGLLGWSLALALLSLAATPATPSVKDVMRRVGAYVDGYGERASIVVATERYTQQTKGNTGAFHGERVIVAEFAVVKVDESLGWQGFRDATEVDGAPVGEQKDRLVRSLMTEGGYIEARRLSDESARYNIGTIQRNFNVPTTALFFFRSESLDRFKIAGKDVRDGVWHLEWRETYKPTFIRTPDGVSIPAHGELWVSPADGSIRRTLLSANMQDAGGQHGTGRVDVSYRFIEGMGMWLPATMDEEWESNSRAGYWERLRGQATYSNYRRFTTSVRIK